MKHIYRLAILGALFLICAGEFHVGAHPAKANEPVMGYWLIETFILGTTKLPQGVTIQASDPSTMPRGYLSLENQTQTTLYVMSLNYKDVLVMATPDPGWKQRVSAAQEAASYLVAPGKPANLSMEALTDLDHNLVDRNVRSVDPPPGNLPIPAAESSELLLVYDQQVIEVPFTLSYQLNTYFSNGSEAYQTWVKIFQATDDASATATQQAAISAVGTRNATIGLSLAVVAVLLVVGWITWRGLHRRT